MRVTIVTPFYNGELFIDRMFDNVEPLLSESIDWVIVDDKSKDDSLSKLRGRALDNKFISLCPLEVNSGPSVARTMGVKESKGDWIYFLDADDLINDNFKGFLKFIGKHIGYNFYYAPLKVIRDYNSFDKNGDAADVDKIRKINKPTDFIRFGFPQPSSLVINKDFYLSHVVDDRLLWGEDFVLYLQLAKSGIGLRWSKVVSCYFINGEGRGSKLSLKLRFDLSKKLFLISNKKNKIIDCYLYTIYLTLRHIASFAFKKIKSKC